MDNQTRILAASQALQAHADSKGDVNADDEQVIDLLADLMHWCNHNDVDFDRSLSMATDHFSEEK